MSGLSMFLAPNAKKVENIKFAASERFTDKDGSPAMWEIRCLTSAENEALRNECMKRVPVPGKKGRYIPELDVTAYLGRLATKSTVFPNLDDAELQNSYGVMGAEALLHTMLTPGEYADYQAKVQDHNMFDLDPQDEVDEAKN